MLLSDPKALFRACVLSASMRSTWGGPMRFRCRRTSWPRSSAPSATGSPPRARTDGSSTPTMLPRACVDSSRARSCSASLGRNCSGGSRSSARTGRRCRWSSCRTGWHSRSARRRKPFSAIASSREGDERWSVLRSTPLLNDAGEVHLVINVFHDITDERSAEARHPLPGRGEHAPLRLPRLRGDARRPRAPARPADRRLLHRGHDRRGRSKPPPGRDLAPESRARRAASRAAATLPAGGERGASRLGGARERPAAPDRGRAGRGARARGSRRRASRALPRARGDVLHRRTAPGAGPAARDDLARDRGVRAAVREDRSRARARDRAAGGARRSTTRVSSEPLRSRTPSSTRCSCRRRWGSASGIAISASCG